MWVEAVSVKKKLLFQMKRDTSERGLNLVVSRQVKKGKQVIFGCRPYLSFLLQGSLNSKRFFFQYARKKAEEKLGRRWRRRRYLCALPMSRQWYMTANIPILILVYLFLHFPELLLFSEQEICFSKATIKDYFQLTSLMFC